jgi:hypothetical protein
MTLLLIAWAFFHPIPASGTDRIWQTEIVDIGNGHNVGVSCSLAIDRFGSLHVAYFDENAHALRYAFRGKSDKTWYTMEVDGQGAGRFISLAVDDHGYPHIAYNSLYENGLHYADWDGRQWHKFVVDPEATSFFLSMQIDADGRPHISYYVRLYADKRFALYLKYAYFDGRTWYIQTVDHRYMTGKFNSLALDAQGQPFIAYSNIYTGDLDYAYRNGDQWQYGIADSQRLSDSYVGTANSVVLDSKGNPHITYLKSKDLAVKYAWRKNGVWKTEVVDHLSAPWSFVDRFSLALDNLGDPHIAYWDPGTGMLKYASRDAKGWHIEAVVDTGHVGGYPSLALDADGNPYIAYYDATEGALHLAHGISNQTESKKTTANSNQK